MQNTTLQGLTMDKDQDGANSITFLNRTGDITISWDEQNKEQILAMVKKKMDEGYSFFTMKKVPLLDIYRKSKVTAKGLSRVKSLSIPDAEFDKLIAGLDDRDVAQIVRAKHANLVKRGRDGRAIDTVKRATSAEEVLRSQSMGVRRIVGG